ncbi:hypothetical protein BT93_L0847 [Corymbia citriodora subsp. variegata]|uniref:DUF4220 domain-containing protein n=1 Tax=Corymbia citriodora subsp. variegata TaxID=360336 RepID=A0A8T0CQD8_CORYI|nr:hypothetical protein BT93_L0847 [Corymbia citriodora subsp. variegata]
MRNLMDTNLKMAPAPAPIPDKNGMNGIMRFWDHSKRTLAQIELLVIITAILLLFLAIFGSCRRRCSSRMFQRVIFAAYTLSTNVLTYALGLMQNMPFHNELFPVWAVFVVIILGSTDSISAYSLGDNERWKSYNWQAYTKLIWLLFLVDWKFETTPKTVVAIVYLLCVLSLKTDERAWALMAASRQSLERDTKVVADHMRREHESVEVDPVSMSGYKYLVTGKDVSTKRFKRFKRFIKRCLGKEAASARDHQTPLDNEVEFITIEQVWKCDGGLLSPKGDPNNEVKDICLSFALFKLLRLRFAGYSLPQEAHKKTRNLIHHGLLSKEDGYKRAFRVVEDELTFLFDFFFTKYSMIFQPGRLYYKLVEFIYVAISIWFTTLILKNYKGDGDEYQLDIKFNRFSIEEVVTSMMMISFSMVEFMQFFFLGFSQWAKLILICKYVQKKSWQENEWIERIIRAICRVKLMKPWEQKLHQYSFLESYAWKPSRLLNNKIMAVYIDQTRNGQRESTPIKLPEEVKEAVFHALKSNYSTKLENGQASLRVNNESKKLLWACRLETQTQVIIVWHIATSFCEHQLPLERLDSLATRRTFLVATSLSKYLAYLVAFTPSLLPDHPYIVKCMFDQAIIEAKDFFRKCKRMKDRVKEMKEDSSGLSALGETVINQGARLGNQLVNDIKHKDMIWRILADFWAELVLYVAPSDNAKAHAEHLTRGGEFVTHLWALLSHAGIERGHPTKLHNAVERRNSHALKRRNSF